MLTNRAIAFLIRFPQIVVLAFLSTLLMVSCRDIGGGLIEKGYDILLTNENSINFSHQYKRHYRFYNYCSHNRVEIVSHTVTAKGLVDSPFTKLKVQPVNYRNLFGINIIGDKTGRYMCFNRKSKLITRVSGAHPRCMFQEVFSPNGMHMMLQSVYNPDFYVGFNKKGKALLGLEYGNLRRDRRCFYFKKLGHNLMDHVHKYHGQKFKKDKMNEKLHDYVKDQRQGAKKTRSSR